MPCLPLPSPWFPLAVPLKTLPHSPSSRLTMISTSSHGSSKRLTSTSARFEVASGPTCQDIQPGDETFTTSALSRKQLFPYVAILGSLPGLTILEMADCWKSVGGVHHSRAPMAILLTALDTPKSKLRIKSWPLVRKYSIFGVCCEKTQTTYQVRKYVVNNSAYSYACSL